MQSNRSRQLRRHDLERLLSATPHLYAPCALTKPPVRPDDHSRIVGYPLEPTPWTQAVVDVVYALMDGIEAASHNAVNPQTGANEKVVRRVPPNIRPELQQYLRVHGSSMVHADPVYRRTRDAIPSGNVFIDSDFQTRRQLESNRAYCEYYRPIQLRFQLIFAIPSDANGRITFAAAMRWDRPFTERERNIGAAIQHHVRRAHACLQWRRSDQAAANQRTLESLDPRAFDSLCLSPRQTEVFYWLACGKRDGEIAAILGASQRTINNHVAAIYQTLGVENRAAAIRLAYETAMSPDPRARL